MKFNLDLPSSPKTSTCLSLYFTLELNMLHRKVREKKQKCFTRYQCISGWWTFLMSLLVKDYQGMEGQRRWSSIDLWKGNSWFLEEEKQVLKRWRVTLATVSNTCLQKKHACLNYLAVTWFLVHKCIYFLVFYTSQANFEHLKSNKLWRYSSYVLQL
jgi:hypothetical protein